MTQFVFINCNDRLLSYRPFLVCSNFAKTSISYPSELLLPDYSRSRIGEHVFIRTLNLKFHCLSPLNKNPKEAKIGIFLI